MLNPAFEYEISFCCVALFYVPNHIQQLAVRPHNKILTVFTKVGCQLLKSILQYKSATQEKQKSNTGARLKIVVLKQKKVPAN